MLYFTTDDPPSSIRNHLPEHVQEIYRQAFNHAWEEYSSDSRQGEIAHRIAWAAVKKAYVKIGAAWLPR